MDSRAEVFVWVMAGIAVAAILGFFALYPDFPLDVQLRTPQTDPELAWYRIGLENLPAGLLGFFLAAIVAIHISTISSSLNLGSLYLTRDLYQRYVNPGAS